ncbi:hypothetical protein [Gimesia sp.]|uniref:hypothetical protein n=1 Tax=Gimesia sp. TaxID=2024833 RepID=UPI0025BC6393|nr:hypothetical protein [Gimesia sp.]
MREFITTISSLIIIACCFCSFLPSEEPEANHSRQDQNTGLNGNPVQSEKPVSRSRLFKKVQAVSVENGVLMFVTIADEGGLREHYFQIRNKNVILCNEGDAGMPLNSIKFEEDSSQTIVVTIPQKYGVDFMEAMTALY